MQLSDLKEELVLDRIIVKNLKIFAFHGVNPEEKQDGQNFFIDIICDCPLRKAGKSDDIEDTVSYAKIVKTAIAVFTAEKFDLIERAADKVACAVLETYIPIASVTVTVKKPEAPINAEFDYVAVEITRKRGDGK